MTQPLTGTIHTVPADMNAVLTKSKKLTDLWNTLTPLVRNEWICYVTIVKRETTRINHLARLREDLLGGKKRPCCWPGCPHHRESAGKWFKGKK